MLLACDMCAILCPFFSFLFKFLCFESTIAIARISVVWFSIKNDNEERTELMVDNKSTINLAKNPVAHRRNKHIAL